MTPAELSWTGPDVFGRTNPTPAHFQHLATRDEHKRLERIRRDTARAFDQRTGGRYVR